VTVGLAICDFLYVVSGNHTSILLGYGDMKPHIYIGVTTLTFCGHVTSSVTWPLDSPYVTSHAWSIATISRTVMKMQSLKHRTLASGSPLMVAHAHTQLPIVLLKKISLLY